MLDKQGWINRPGVDESFPGLGVLDTEVDEVEVAVSSLVGEMSLVSLACCKSEISTDGTGCAVGVGWALGTGSTVETYRTMVVH